MQHDAPAGFPLIGFIAGLLLGPSCVWWTALGLVAIALLVRRPRIVAMLLACAAALLVARPRPVLKFDPQRFVTIEARVDRDWQPHADSYALRVQYQGRPLAIYVRFAPPPIAMHTSVRAEGLLRTNDRGDLVMTVKSPRLMEMRGTLALYDPERWNRAAVARLAPYARERPDEVALAEALALGRGEQLSESVRDGFRHGGTYHLLVFSGMQIACAAAFIAWLLRRFGTPRASDVSLLLFAVGAPLFIGPTASVSRAAIGVGLYALARLLKRPTSLENLWCVAALLRLAIAPDDLTDAAFQLTYAGAGALLFAAKPLARYRGRWIVYALAAEVVMTPLTLFHFHQFALAGSLTTIVLSPLIAAMLLLSAIVCAVPNMPTLVLLGWLHHVCAFINDLAAHASGFYAAPKLLVVTAAASLAAIAFLGGRARAIAILAAFLIALPLPPPAKTELIALDVGQGDAIVVRDEGHAILIDGGGRSDDPRFGESTLLPLLVDHGIRRLDVVVLTHAHPDHCGGLPAVLQRMDVGEVWLSPHRFRGECARRMLDAIEVPIHLAREGDAFTAGTMRATVLLAGKHFRRASENNGSIVLRVQVGRTRILLTGDVEREAEGELLERNVRADVLKVAHHGSRSSSTAALLDRVRPRIAVISCGRHNLFGHPHPSVLRALAARHIAVRRTDRDGTVTLPLPQIDTGK